jgi:hypothetical protein
MNVKLALLQGIDEIVTICCGWFGVSWPFEGLIEALVPPIPTGANQLRFPGEVSPTITVQVYVVSSLFSEQLLEVGSILVGATVNCGGEGGGATTNKTPTCADILLPLQLKVKFKVAE